MTFRSIVLVGALVLAPACSRNSSSFVGTYDAVGEMDIAYFGAPMTYPRTDTVRISEATSTDLVLLTRGGCLLPAQVDGDVATLVPNTSCTDTVTLIEGSAGSASLVVTRGSLRRTGDVLTLTYEGVATTVWATIPSTSNFTVTLTLTGTTALGGPPALRER